MSSSTKHSEYDVVIIGGGMVGASLVAALREHKNIRVAVIEAHAFDCASQPSFDDRSIALSYGSRRIWESMGLWSKLEPLIEPIKTIHVSDRGHFGVTRIKHHEERVEALGYVVENRVLGRVLMDTLEDLPQLDWYCPASIQSIEQAADHISLDVSVNKPGEDQVIHLSASLLVAADGLHSATRELAGIGVSQQDYQQSAIIANVQTDQAHQGIAYERFTDSGPLAFLPMTQNRYSVVWTCRREQSEPLMQLGDAAFINALQQRFGYRAGNIIKTGRRTSYPLKYTEAEQLTKGRVVIIGNAAHALHPVSGQGYNLALRDVAELAEHIVNAGDAAEDVGHSLLLAEYHARRYQDMRRVYRITDSMVRVFSNNDFMLGHLRATGLLGLDFVPGLRSLVARQSMGLLGRMNKLQRRLSL